MFNNKKKIITQLEKYNAHELADYFILNVKSFKKIFDNIKNEYVNLNDCEMKIVLVKLASRNDFELIIWLLEKYCIDPYFNNNLIFKIACDNLDDNAISLLIEFCNMYDYVWFIWGFNWVIFVFFF